MAGVRLESAGEGSVSAQVPGVSLSPCLAGGAGEREKVPASPEGLLLMASSQRDMEDWVQAIRRVIWAPFGGGTARSLHARPLEPLRPGNRAPLPARLADPSCPGPLAGSRLLRQAVLSSAAAHEAGPGRKTRTTFQTCPPPVRTVGFARLPLHQTPLCLSV